MNLCNYTNSGESEAVNTDFDYAKMTDEASEDTWEKIDIAGLNAETQQIVAREQKLLEDIDKIIAEIKE